MGALLCWLCGTCHDVDVGQHAGEHGRRVILGPHAWWCATVARVQHRGHDLGRGREEDHAAAMSDPRRAGASKGNTLTATHTHKHTHPRTTTHTTTHCHTHLARLSENKDEGCLWKRRPQQVIVGHGAALHLEDDTLVVVRPAHGPHDSAQVTHAAVGDSATTVVSDS